MNAPEVTVTGLVGLRNDMKLLSAQQMTLYSSATIRSTDPVIGATTTRVSKKHLKRWY